MKSEIFQEAVSKSNMTIYSLSFQFFRQQEETSLIFSLQETVLYFVVIVI